MKELTKDNFNELEIGEIYTFDIKYPVFRKHVIGLDVIALDASIICIITDIDILNNVVYFNIILTDNTNFWYTGPDEANINRWNVKFEKIQTENEGINIT